MVPPWGIPRVHTRAGHGARSCRFGGPDRRGNGLVRPGFL